MSDLASGFVVKNKNFAPQMSKIDSVSKIKWSMEMEIFRVADNEYRFGYNWGSKIKLLFSNGLNWLGLKNQI